MIGWQSPYALAAAGLLALAAVVDFALRGRYAAGSAARDAGTARRLIVSLNTNLAVLLALPALNVASFPLPIAGELAPIGLAICGLGLVVRYAAIARLGRHFTWQVSILDDHTLETAGLFGLVRHPSYTGGILAMVGAALAFGSWGALVFFVLTHVPILVQRVRVEERALAAAFGDAWRAYAARTARLVPFVW